MTLVALTGLTRRLGDRDVVASADLAIAPGETVALMGPSGCGKTTLLQMIGLIDRPDSGSVALGGCDAWAASDSTRAALRLRSIGFVFQHSNLIEHLSVRDNVALPAWRATGSRKAALAEADRLLGRFGLAERSTARASVLSIGEAQRAAIARAMINRPRLIIADEPTGSLDAVAAQAVIEALLGGGRPPAGERPAVLIATHDPDVAARADRTVRMRDGRLGTAA